MLRGLSIFVALVAACLTSIRAEDHSFCDNGILWPTSIAPDATVRITVLEGPLFSVTLGPTPGTLLSAFHVALFFEAPTPRPIAQLNVDAHVHSAI